MNRFGWLAGAGAAVLTLTLTAACRGDVSVPPPAPSTAVPSLAETVSARVLNAKTAMVQVAITHGSGDGKTAVEGALQLDASGARADLSGLVLDSAPARIVLIGNDVYLQRVRPTVWQRLRADGEWPFITTTWASIDFLLEALRYAADADLLEGLAYTDAPIQELDGVPVRTSVVAVDGADFLGSLSEAQQRRFEAAYTPFDGVRIQLYLDNQLLPRRLIASLAGRNLSVDITYRDWGTTASTIEPPTTNAAAKRA
jgi:hypothetical protein